MSQSVLAEAAGLFDILIALCHLAFSRLFGWPERLRVLDRVNRALMQVLNFAIVGLFVVVGVTLYLAASEASAGLTGRLLLGGLALFWLLRTVAQPIAFGSHPLSLLLTGIFAIGAALHVVPLLVSAG